MRYFTDIKNRLDEMEREGDLDAHRVLRSADAKECQGHHNNVELCQTSSEMYGHILSKEKLEVTEQVLVV